MNATLAVRHRRRVPQQALFRERQRGVRFGQQGGELDVAGRQHDVLDVDAILPWHRPRIIYLICLSSR
jgi:hypothetical protein